MSSRTPSSARKLTCNLVLLVLLLGLLAAGPVAAAPLREGEPPPVEELVMPLPEAATADFAAPAAASQHLVYKLAFNRPSPNVLALNEDLTFTFDYKTTRPGGVRIWIRPVTNGSPTPNYAAHGSPLYPTGSGSGNGYFTIETGAVTVDAISIEMWSDGQTALLFRTVMPVHYQFRTTTHLVSHITFNPQTPNLLQTSQRVNIAFSYRTTFNGVRIWSLPFTNGSPTDDYAVDGSQLFPSGTGVGTSFITIDSPAKVDHIRIQMWTNGETALLFETFLPVHYEFGNRANRVTKFALNPSNANVMEFDQRVNFTFDYATSQAGGVFIWVRPMTSGQLTLNYAAHPSPLHPTGSGSGDGFLTVMSGVHLVDHFRVEMWNATQTVLLYRGDFPVHYQYGALHRSLIPYLKR